MLLYRREPRIPKNPRKYCVRHNSIDVSDKNLPCYVYEDSSRRAKYGYQEAWSDQVDDRLKLEESHLGFYGLMNKANRDARE